MAPAPQGVGVFLLSQFAPLAIPAKYITILSIKTHF